MKICKCGCGQECKNTFVSGHNTKGCNHPMYGKHHKEESKLKMSSTKKLKKQSPPNKRFNLSKEELYDMYCNKMMTSYQIADTLGLKTKKSVLDWLRKFDISVRESVFEKGHPVCKGTEHTRFKKGEHYNRKTEFSKEMWSNKEWAIPLIKKRLSTSCARPNKFESACGIVLEELYPKQFKYVGDGSVLINGRSPDFIDEKNKVVVLAHGIYFHLYRLRKQFNRPDLEKWEVEIKDKKPFEDVHYKVIFVWEDELLENIENVIEKIKYLMEGVCI